MPLRDYLYSTIDKKHKEIGQKPFRKRYSDDASGLTLRDHYDYLCQLLPIYTVLEQKVQQLVAVNFIQLSDDLKFILDRRERIRADLEFIEKKLSIESCPVPVTATDEYVNTLKSADIENESVKKGILLHFLIALLGDAFGGQSLKRKVRKLCNDPDNPEETDNRGASFYDFGDKISSIKQWANNLETFDSNPNEIQQWNDDAFDAHIRIFDELEKAREAQAAVNVKAETASVRLSYHPDKLLCHPERSEGSATQPAVSMLSLFSRRNAAIVAASATAVVAVGTCLATDYCKFGSR